MWYCAINYSSGINLVLAKTCSITSAQSALDMSSGYKAIIPMDRTDSNTQQGAGDPHSLDKTWPTGSMAWEDWNTINPMRAKCAKEVAPSCFKSPKGFTLVGKGDCGCPEKG